MSTEVKFTVNGTEYTVSGKSVTDKLVHFLRDKGLTGARITCYEGGCGACTVVASTPIPGSASRRTFSVNSCLASLYGCDGWDITTIEGLGNQFDGLHILQQGLSDGNGTQCGFCSPGMVMNMYGLTQSNPDWTAADVEKNLDGNLCRCTGYRPILDAFKSITPLDIEDAAKKSRCRKGRLCCKDRKKITPTNTRSKREITVDGVTWYQPQSLQELTTILANLGSTTYSLIAGDTSSALYYNGFYSAYINTRMVSELYTKTVAADQLEYGVNISITELIEEFESVSTQNNFAYLAELSKQWHLVANGSVRNLGTVGGNLAMRTQHPEFPSDILVSLLAADVKVNVSMDAGSSSSYMDLETLLAMDLNGTKSVLVSLRFDPLPLNSVFRMIKVMPQNGNSKSFLCGAFCVQMAGNVVTGTPRLVFNGINPTFVRATQTESYMIGKDLSDPAVIQGILTTLAGEVNPDSQPQDAPSSYRKSVAQNILYKFILGIVSDSVSSDYLSGASDLIRGTSSGVQTYQIDPTDFPLGEPIKKMEADVQCTGEAQFIGDMPPTSDELHGMFLQSTQANATIKSIDPTAALNFPGIVGFLSAQDIPGTNNLTVYTNAFTEELFASSQVMYYGQAIGLLVGTSTDALYGAIGSIVVEYENIQSPILTIPEAIANGPVLTLPVTDIVIGDADAGLAASDQVISGQFSRGGQYHLHMENQTTKVVPIEDGFEVYSSTQWATETQNSIGRILGIPNHLITLYVRRCGGAFGAKILRGNIIAAATALAASVFRKPTTISLDLSTNMQLIGWREPYLFDYEVGVSNEGTLMAIKGTFTGDPGYQAAESSAFFGLSATPSCYDCPNWHLSGQTVKTNTPMNTACRTPGTVEAIHFMEYVLDHVADVLNMDPFEFRQLNLISENVVRQAVLYNPRIRSTIKQMGPRYARLLKPLDVPMVKINMSSVIDQLLVSSDFYNRLDIVKQFNVSNRWHKKGITFMPMLWPHNAPDIFGYGVQVSIYANDASVMISHGGTEMGQGINTKVAQVAAYTLGCEFSQIKVKPTNTFVGANSSDTDGSMGTDFNMNNMQRACAELRTRLDSTGKPTFEEKVKEANALGLDLCQRHWNGSGEVKSYGVYAAACVEVELDILTGQFLVLRVDILEDAGKSPNPLLDVGQIEGGFIFGQGLMTMEKAIYDPTTGQKLTASTWDYAAPSALDIPIDFRVALMENQNNPVGVVGSKVTQEPPVVLAVAIPMALRQAIKSARLDAGNSDWFRMDCPLTIDNIQQLCLVDQSMLTDGN